MSYEREPDKNAGGRERSVVLDGELLRALRHEQDLTQEALAEAAGISTRSYQNAEGGQRISRRLGHQIAVALERPFAALVKSSGAEVRTKLDEAGFAPLPPPRDYAARAAELAQIRSALVEEGGARCCLTGPTGIGKTAMALQAAASLASEFDGGVIWVTASRNRSESAALAAMTHIAQALGFGHRLPSSETVSFEAVRQTFLKRLFERRLLLILDDVESVETGRHFLGDEVVGWTLLTTTRRSVADTCGESQLALGPLTEAASLELFTAHLGPERVGQDPAASRALVRLLGGVPRNLLIASSVLRQEQVTTLGDYLSRVRSLDRSELADKGRWLRSRDEESFVQSYAQLRCRLQDRSWAFFGALCHFEDALFTPRWAAATAGVSLHEARHHLSVLDDAYLLKDVPRGSSGERAFVLDAQAQRVAHAIGAGTRGEARDRLCRFALDEARRIGEMAVGAGERALMAEIRTFRQCLDLMTSMVQPAVGGEILADPEALSPVEPPLEEPARLLPEVVVAMRGVLELKCYPEAGWWFSEALRVAHHEGDQRRFGLVAATLGRWWGMHRMGFEQMERLCGAAAKVLAVQGEPEAAYRAQFDAACGRLSMTPSPSVARSFERCLELAEQEGLPPRYRAHALGSLACVHGAFATSSESWERAVSYCERALACSPAETVLDRVTRDVVLINLAVLRSLGGSPPPEEELDTALSTLLELAGDDQLLSWLIQRMGSWLGGDRKEGTTRLTPRGQRALFLAVDAEAVPGRLVRLLSLVIGRMGIPSDATDQSRAALTEIVMGTPLEIELGYVLGLVYPASLLEELLDANGMALARTFVEAMADDGHPAFRIIDFLEDTMPAVAGLAPLASGTSSQPGGSSVRGIRGRPRSKESLS